MELSTVEQAIVDTLRSHYASLREAFLSLDQRGDSVVKADELRVGLQKFGLDLRPETCAALVSKYDLSKTGGFNYDEFVRLNDCRSMQFSSSSHSNFRKNAVFQTRVHEGGVDALIRSWSERQRAILSRVQRKLEARTSSSGRSINVHNTFLHLDHDRSGVLTYDQIRFALSQFGCQVSPRDLATLLAGVDSDHNGVIDYNEFVALLVVPMNSVVESQEAPEPVSWLPTVTEHRPDGKRPSIQQPPSPTRLPQALERIANDVPDSVAISKMAMAISDERLKLRQAFTKMDADGSGLLTETQLQEGLRDFGLNVTPAKVSRLFQRFASDGKFRYSNFVRMISETMADAHEEHTVNNATPASAASAQPSATAAAAGAGDANTSADASTATGDANVTSSFNWEEESNDVSATIAEISFNVYANFKKMKDAFTSFDRRGDKRIDLGEFKKAIDVLGVDNVSDGDIEGVFHMFEDPKTKTMAYHDFIRMLAAATPRV